MLFVVSSFAYLVGTLIGRVSDKEIRKNLTAFKKFDKLIWVIFMFVALIISFLESWYSVAGILLAFAVILLAEKRMHRFTALPLILGLSAAFRNDFFIILLSLGTFYIMIFGMIFHKDNQIKIVLRSQVRYIILALIGLFIPVIINLFELGAYQVSICSIIISFLASLITVGEYEHLFRGKSYSKL